MTMQSTSNIQAAIYARVSSDAQAEEQTIDSQVAALREQVAKDNVSLHDENCFFDDGVSGSTLNRPALERLRDSAYVGGFQRLYVHSPDRLARKYAYQVLLVDELQKHGIEIVFLNRAIGVSPEEDLLLQMQGMFAEYERANDLRRAFATANAEKLTADALQALMRHKSYTTTQRYINMSRQLNRSVEALHVPDVLKRGTA